MAEPRQRISKHLITSVGFAALLLTILFILCFQFSESGQALSDTNPVVINLALFVGGWAFGWVLGTLVAPYDENEATLFSSISKAASAFVSGYLLAKIDPLVTYLLDPKAGFSSLFVFRVILLISVTIIIMLVVFFARKYTDWHRSD
jgi:hypothetical protein